MGIDKALFYNDSKIALFAHGVFAIRELESRVTFHPDPNVPKRGANNF